MPIQTAFNPEQAATQALFDQYVLRVIRSGDAAAAQALSAMSLAFAAAQS